MNRFSEANFRETSTKPAKTHSPDYRSGNKIKPTKSPQNIQYILRQNDVGSRTPNKESNIYKKQPNTVISRYFPNNTGNRPDKMYESPYPSAYTENKSRVVHGSHCEAHCHCAYGSNNQEVVLELRRIITMINGAQVSTFDPNGDDTKKQIQNLKLQNQKLLALVDRLKTSTPESRIDQSRVQSQNKILRQQLTQNRVEHERQREQLYRTNKTLSSQLKSLQDRNTTNQKEIDTLRSMIKNKDQGQTFQSRRKNPQQRLSLSMIKQQYNQSIRVLKINWAAQIENKLIDYENQIRQYSMRLDTLEERLKNQEDVMELNKRLNRQVNNLKRILQARYDEQLMQRSQSNPDLQRLQRQKLQMSNYIKQLNKQLNQQKQMYDRQIADLKSRNLMMQQRLAKQTEDRVKKLVQTYDKQIVILRRQAKSNICNHKDIQLENSRLRQEYQRTWQEVLKLRNELAKQTTLNSKLQQDLNNHKIQINKLNHQLNDQQARTTLLSSQINHLRSRLQDQPKTSQQPRQTQQKAIQNQRLKDQIRKQDQQLIQKRNQIGKLTNKLNNQHLKLLAQTKLLENENYRLKKQLEHFKNNDNINQNQESLITQLTKIRSNEESLTMQLNKVKTQKERLQEQVKNSKIFVSAIKQDDQKQINRLRKQLVQNALDISRLETQIYEQKTQINKLNHQLSDTQLNLTAKTKLLQNQIDQLRRQLDNSENRAKYLPALEQQNKKLKQQLINTPNMDEINNQFDNLQRNLKDSNRKCQQLELEKDKLLNQLNRTNDDLKRQQEQKSLSNRQLEQLKARNNNQFQNLQDQIRKLKNDNNRLRQNLDTLSETHNIQSKQKQDKIVYLWDTIQALNRNISETQPKVAFLQNKIGGLNNQNQRLRSDLVNTRQEYQNILKLNQENWQYKINSLQRQNDYELTRLRQLIITKETQQETLIKKMSIKISSVKGQSLKKQLQELKNLVDEAKLDKIQQQLTTLSDNYQKQLSKSQQKTNQIDQLNRQKANLSDRISQLQRVKLGLGQKINILEGNIRILEDQLRQRKNDCQNHLNQKALLQKQNMLLKRSKIERQSIQATRSRAKEISQKIDRLITLEKQRQKNLGQISREQILTQQKSISSSSVVRKLEYPQV